MKIVATEKAPKALGPYSQGYVHNGVLYTAGQIAINPEVNDVEATTIEAQTEQVCKNLGEVLKEAGTSFDKVLKTVQETARERVRQLSGLTLEALVEEQNEQDSSLVTGRLSNNTLVHFPGDVSLIGNLVPVYLKEYKGFYFLGERAGGEGECQKA